MKRIATILLTLALFATASAAGQTKVKVKYKKHTEFDFSGDRVDGRLKGAGVFYIFQRKRSQGHKVIHPPASMAHHSARSYRKIKKVVSP